MMKILVTGGAGFIGSHLVHAYVAKGHEVVVLDNLSTGKREFIHPKATFYKMDLQDSKIAEVLEKEKISIINHHAAQSSVGRSVSNPIFDANSNIIGTLQLLQNAVECKVNKIIFASTGGAIYGDQENLPVGEDAPCRPVSPYAISKLSVEHYLSFFKDCHGLKFVSLRYSNVFGPRQDPFGESGVIAIFCQRLAENKAPIICGDGKQTRDFISVDDVVRANILALEPDCPDGVFNVGTEIETSINDLTRELMRVSERNLKIQYAPQRKGEQRRSSIQNGKMYEALGWKPIRSLKEGLVDTYRYFSSIND